MNPKKSHVGAPRKAPHLKKIPIGIALPYWLVERLSTDSRSKAVIIESWAAAAGWLPPEIDK